MTFEEQRCDLLGFLVNVSHQLESLLSFNQEFTIVNLVNEREENPLSSKEAQEGSTTTNNHSDNLNYFDAATTATDFSQPSHIPTRIAGSQESNCSQREEEWSDHYQHDYSNNGLPQEKHQQYHNQTTTTAATRIIVPNLVRINQLGYSNTAHYYVPSESANFVNYTQYSAKPSQRQDTGYVYRDGALSLEAMPQSQLFPPPPLSTSQIQLAPQEYQTECAYCCWLETTATAMATATTSSQPQSISMEPISNGIAHFVDSSNYAYQSG